MIERRNLLGLSLQTVADHAGLTKSHIWDLEAGKAKNPSLNSMIGISV
ncbi:helix-turn-helix domain-containing protein, partial [Streptococcus pneumoniae]|nr:helix-turn-helix domain-containing protein [Streptococcus pneumoniae]